MSKNLITIMYFLISCAFASFALIIYLFFYFSENLPDYHQLSEYNPPAITRFYSYDGTLIEQYAKENRIYAHYEEIPKILVNAFIAAEDKNFFEHPGVDLISIMRAALQNIVYLGRNKSLVGGSTITQQVVKNFLLTNEQSISRKIKEAILSFRISQAYSKERILELYLNQIYLGNGAYGVVSASLAYFNKPLEELTISEVAFLAALPKAPSNYDPKKNYDKSLNRRNYVINRMLEDKYITIDEAKNSLSEPLNVVKRAQNIFAGSADYFAESVRQEVISKFGEETLYQGGLSIRTTLNNKLQIIAAKSLKEAIINYDRKTGYRGVLTNIGIGLNPLEDLKNLSKNYHKADYLAALILKVDKDKISVIIENGEKSIINLSTMKWAKNNLNDLNKIFHKGDLIIVDYKNNHYELAQIPQISGALVAMEVKTGRVLAMIGGYDFKASKFNRATQAYRQPGSVFKPFVYLAALENNYPPNYIIDDSPFEMSQGAGLPIWAPKNYKNDFLGPITLRTALEKSRNLVTVKIGQKIGIERIMEITSRFGINDNPQRHFATLLGSSETTLLKMTAAYASIANNGFLVKPDLIEYIQDLGGKVHYRRFSGSCVNCNIGDGKSGLPYIDQKYFALTDARSAYQLTSILQGTIERGTGRRANILGPHIAGKTGTTNDSKDAWFIGYTTDLVVGVYLGYDQPRTLGANVTGGTLALPVFVDFMKEALKIYPAKPFPVPAGIALKPIDADTGNFDIKNTPKNRIIYEAFKIDEFGAEEQIIGEEKNEDLGLTNENLQIDESALSEENDGSEDVDAGLGGIY